MGGFLGALGGLGEGMSDYASSLNEQRKLDWTAQQDRVKFERQQNLENLRASNNRTAAGEQRTFLEGQAEDSRTFQTSEREAGETARTGSVVAGYIDGVPKTKAEVEAMDPIERKDLVSPEAYKQKAAVDSAVAVKRAGHDLENEYTAEALGKLRESEWYKGASPQLQQVAELNLSVNGKLDLGSLTKDLKDLEAPEKGHLEVAMGLLEENEAFTNSTAPAKLLWVTMEATKIANPGKQVMGTKVLPDGKVQDVVEKILDGKISASDIMQLNMEGQQKIYTALKDYEGTPTATQKPAQVRPEGALTGSRNIQSLASGGSQIRTGVKGRQAIEAITSPFKKKADTGYVSERQRQAALEFK